MTAQLSRYEFKQTIEAPQHTLAIAASNAQAGQRTEDDGKARKAIQAPAPTKERQDKSLCRERAV